MRVLDAGLLTTVQDLGRFGYQKDGITPGGAMDGVALRVANRLVGNEENEAALEITMKGPSIEFLQDAVISICGADLSPMISDVEVPNWCAILIKEGARLTFGEGRWGCRAYLAVAGGIAAPDVMDSKSTYLRAGIGGMEGRPLKSGDELPIGPGPGKLRPYVSGPLPFALTDRRLRPDDAMQLYPHDSPVRVVAGPHWDHFNERDRKMFLREAYEVSPSSDRMGYRLTGPLLNSSKRDELVSSAVVPGTVQVPPSGEAIVLMADRQTTGGYPVIGVVVTADLPAVAQLRPGESIRFEEITIDGAQRALRSQAERLKRIRKEMIADTADRS